MAGIAINMRLLLRLLLVMTALVAVSESYTSRYCPVTYLHRIDYQVRYRYCYRSWWRTRCFYRWYWRTRYEVRTNHTNCCPNWGGTYCHTPICRPGCPTGGVCTAFGGIEDKVGCYCREITTGSCYDYQTCDDYSRDCFPGFCDSNGACKCVSGYEGSNCETISEGPTFQYCSLLLVDKDDQTKTFAEFTCRDDNFQNFTYYSKERDFNLLFHYGTTYELPPDNPQGVRYLAKYVPGIVEAYTNITLTNKDGEEDFGMDPAWESTDVSEEEPRLINSNDKKFFQMRDAMKHLDTLDVGFVAKTGGYKVIHNQGNSEQDRTDFTGIELMQQVRLVFDLVPPDHCIADNSCDEDDELGYPLWVEPDVTRGEVTILWSSWHDEDSGIGNFSYAIYSMGINAEGLLEEKWGSPVATGVWAQEDEDPPTFTASETGMYSVILTVTDLAANENRARSLFLADPTGKMEVDESKPLHFANAAPETGYDWITKNVTQDGLECDWAGHFTNKFYMDNKLLGEVKPLGDGFDDEDGNRTTAEIVTNGGIASFHYGIHIAHASDYLRSEPENWVNNSLQDTVTLSGISAKDGDVIRLFVKATDVAQHIIVEYRDTRVDSSAPVLVSGNTKFNPNAPTLYPLPQFASIVNVNVVDEQGGLDEISYDLIEVKREQETIIQSETQPVATEPASRIFLLGDQSCKASGQCYCVAETCYMRYQPIVLNNCWFMNRDIISYRLRFRAFNPARLGTEGSFDIPGEDVSGLLGEGEYPPIPEGLLKVAEGKLTEYSATLTWRHPDACYKVQSTELKYTVTGKARTEVVTGMEAKLEGLCSDTLYTVDATLVYADGARSDPMTLEFRTQEGDTRCGSGLGAGVIAGIAIGILLLLLLVAVLALLLVRRRQHKPMVPRPITQRFSQFMPGKRNGHSGHSEPPPPYRSAYGGQDVFVNKAYEQGMDAPDAPDDIYVEDSVVANRWKFPSDRIVLGNFLRDNPNAKDPGRFSDIRMATLYTRSGNREVVAKMPTATSTRKDRALMTEKMNFFGNRHLEFHRNVLNFIGAVPEHENGPVLLFDFCNRGRLSDWLKRQPHITDDVEYQMSNFCIMVACGMEFLHGKEIIHKRLGARNILLMEKDGVIHAKIAGFGPMREQGASKKMIPARWFAPEQMESDEGEERIYTKETDVWTLGVLLWEIYSKGGKPYDGISVPDLKREVVNGHRMQRPEYCPDFVYNSVMMPCWSLAPDDRPTMSAAYNRLKEHFEGPGGQTGYYDETELRVEEDELYYDATTSKAAAAGY